MNSNHHEKPQNSTKKNVETRPLEVHRKLENTMFYI